MTAYRYVRTGRLVADKVGTAWVVTVEALDQFVAEAATEAVDPDASSRPAADWRGRLMRALVEGDEPSAWRIIEQALAAGRTPVDCYLDLLAGALAEIGTTPVDPRVVDSGSEVAEGYVATATASRLVARLGARFRRSGRSRGTVVFGAPLGELHSLPIAIVADLVRLEGFTCLELGANVPPQAFAGAAANADRLVAVGIGVTTAANLDAVRATVEAVNRAVPDAAVLLGGQGVLNPDIAQLTGATDWAADGLEAVAAVNEIAARTTPALRVR